MLYSTIRVYKLLWHLIRLLFVADFCETTFAFVAGQLNFQTSTVDYRLPIVD